MNSVRIILLKIALWLGALYYVIGAIAHFFGLTLFPFYDGALYSTYHDTMIALTAIIISIMLFSVSKNPVRNIDVYNGILLGGIIAIIFSIWAFFNIDYTALGAPGKNLQSIVEFIALVIYVVLLFLLRPKD